ncbi:MAG: MBL fold metallo-hydrolase [Clostridia bacterium]|nr:MBL fold metallo-hydrolase [Clostridia bacterium]
MEKLIQYCTRESLYDGPFNNKVGWHAAGMGYLIVTENGKLIVIDGGCPNDTEDFLSLLEQNAEGRPVVDLWIITHAHSDHFGVIDRIAKTPQLRERLEVREFLWRFPEEFVEGNGNMPHSGANTMMQGICDTFGAAAHAPELDEKLTVDGMELHFLYYTYDCRIVNNAFNTNACSLIFTVQGKNQKAMFTGDAVTRNLYVLCWLYHKKLKCDILQLPHHALCDTGLLAFYKEVDAAIVLEPTCIAGDRAMHSELYCNTEKGRWTNWVEENAAKVYKSFQGTKVIEL